MTSQCITFRRLTVSNGSVIQGAFPEKLYNTQLFLSAGQREWSREQPRVRIYNLVLRTISAVSFLILYRTMSLHSTAAENPPPPPYDEAWQNSLNTLQDQITTYEAAEQRDDGKSTEEEAQRITAAMRDLGDRHADPKVQAEWYGRAEFFSRGTRKTRLGVLKPVKNIVHTLLSVPRVIIGTALHIVGGVIHTAGSIVGDAGGMVTGHSNDRRQNRGRPRLVSFVFDRPNRH